MNDAMRTRIPGPTPPGRGVRRAALAALLTTAALLTPLALAGCNRSDGTAGKSPATKTESKAAKAAETGPSKGVGPVKSVELGPLDEALAARGEQIFSGTCAACHKLDQRYVGPSIRGVTLRRTPEWILNMIVNPMEMTQKDPTAKAMLAEYMTQMSVSASQEDARAILEYFRKVDAE